MGIGKDFAETALITYEFLRHNYFLLYYIGNDEIVYITNIFHGLEDFENKLR